MITVDRGRVLAVARKEFREYRHNRFILGTMVVMPVVFLGIPIFDLFRIPATARETAVRAGVGTTLLLMLLTPVIIPATIAAYSVIGERDQGTLEPVLTTPVTREELMLGKAAAVFLPAVAVAYAFFAVMALAIRAGATAAVVHSVWQAPNFLAQALFAPLLAGWSVWIGMAVSARSSDVRVAQQLSTVSSLPALALTSLMSYQVVPTTVPVAIALAASLALANVAGWRVASALFDRERLVVGSGEAPQAPPGADGGATVGRHDHGLPHAGLRAGAHPRGGAGAGGDRGSGRGLHDDG